MRKGMEIALPVVVAMALVAGCADSGAKSAGWRDELESKSGETSYTDWRSGKEAGSEHFIMAEGSALFCPEHTFYIDSSGQDFGYYFGVTVQYLENEGLTVRNHVTTIPDPSIRGLEQVLGNDLTIDEAAQLVEHACNNPQ